LSIGIIDERRSSDSRVYEGRLRTPPRRSAVELVSCVRLVEPLLDTPAIRTQFCFTTIC